MHGLETIKRLNEEATARAASRPEGPSLTKALDLLILDIGDFQRWAKDFRTIDGAVVVKELAELLENAYKARNLAKERGL